MKLPRLVLTVSTGLVAAVAAVAALSADKPAIKPSVGSQPDRRPAPAQLGAAVRAARVKAVLKAGGFANLASASSGPRLTPVAPAHASGAAITYAGPGVLLGADADEPDGAFLLQHSSVQMRFPTTAQKVYVLTCSFDLFINPKAVTVKRAGAANASVPLEGGHILHAFQAGGAVTNLNLEIVPTTNFPSTGYFYGCDLGPAS
jgi:hypothetical protein